MRSFLVIVVLACVAITASGLSPKDASMMRFAQVGVCLFTSADLVVDNGGSAGVKPKLTTCPLAPPLILTCQSYLSAASCLSASGPLGALGPLGAMGAIGKNFWNPSTVIDAARDYEQFQSANKIAANPNNPLSSAGPLGPAYDANLRKAKGNDFLLHLDALGLFGVLGPLGPLGPLGVLGPLGPNGIHSFTRKATGEYAQGSNVQRKFEAAWDGSSKKTWPLFEMYDKTSTARNIAGQDTSFGAYGSLSAGPLVTASTDFVDFTSAEEQYVTVIAVPENALDALTITISTIDKQGGKKGAKLLSAGSTYYIPWAQLKVPAGAALRAEVSLAFSSRAMLLPVSIPFRIYVVGSTSLFKTTPISGPHIKSGTC